MGAFFGSKLSPHILKNPAGFLICKDVPIARLGTQKYLGREIGINERANDVITVYRLEEEVFSPKAMASFEGCPFTEEHPMDFVQPQNSDAFVKGTVVNVRRGTGKDSDLLLADIIIYGKQEIDFVESKEKREISCGYECEYVPYKDGYKQINIVGNHVALVSAGRAGGRVAIQDTAEKSLNKDERSKRMGYRIPRKSNVSDFVKAVGLKTLAADAEPEEVQEMVEGLVDEKKAAEADAEPVVIEAEPDTHDEEIAELKESVQNIKDAIYAMLDADEEEVEDECEEAEDEETGVEALDELETELESNDEDVLEEVQSVEESDEDIEEKVDDEECEDEGEEMTTDSILELARVIKPIIASVPDTQKRKRMSDSLAAVLRKHAKKANDNANKNYAAMLNRTKDSYEQPVDLGMEIARKNNPHYKEVK